MRGRPPDRAVGESPCPGRSGSGLPPQRPSCGMSPTGRDPYSPPQTAWKFCRHRSLRDPVRSVCESHTFYVLFLTGCCLRKNSFFPRDSSSWLRRHLVSVVTWFPVTLNCVSCLYRRYSSGSRLFFAQAFSVSPCVPKLYEVLGSLGGLSYPAGLFSLKVCIIRNVFLISFPSGFLVSHLERLSGWVWPFCVHPYCSLMTFSGFRYSVWCP